MFCEGVNHLAGRRRGFAKTFHQLNRHGEPVRECANRQASLRDFFGHTHFWQQGDTKGIARALLGGGPGLALLLLPLIIYHQEQLIIGSILAKRFAIRREATGG